MLFQSSQCRSSKGSRHPWGDIGRVCEICAVLYRFFMPSPRAIVFFGSELHATGSVPFSPHSTLHRYTQYSGNLSLATQIADIYWTKGPELLLFQPSYSIPISIRLAVGHDWPGQYQAVSWFADRGVRSGSAQLNCAFLRSEHLTKNV